MGNHLQMLRKEKGLGFDGFINDRGSANFYFRKLKEENAEERKKKRLERLKRKKEKLEEIEKTLESNLDDAEKQKRIKQIEKKGIQKSNEIETEVEETESKPKGRDWTLSIALPGSILDNAQSPELRLGFMIFRPVFLNCMIQNIFGWSNSKSMRSVSSGRSNYFRRVW